MIPNNKETRLLRYLSMCLPSSLPSRSQKAVTSQSPRSLMIYQEVLIGHRVERLCSTQPTVVLKEVNFPPSPQRAESVSQSGENKHLIDYG